MLDFTEKKLFDSEKNKFNKFLDKKLQTNTEYDESILEDEDSTSYDDFDFDGSGFEQLDNDSFDIYGSNDDNDFGGFGGFGNDFGGGMNSFNSQGDELGEIERDSSWEQKKGVVQFLLSFPYTIKNATKFFMFKAPTKDEWDDILGVWEIVNLVTLLFCGLSYLLGFKYLIISNFWMGIISLISFVITELSLFFIYKKGLVAKVMKIEPNENGEPEEDKESSEESGLGGLFAEEEEETGLGSFTGFDDVEEDSDEYFDEEEIDISYDDEDLEEVELEKDDTAINLSKSNIDMSNLTAFNRTLLDTFVNNIKYSGQISKNRYDLLESFSNYLITNDDSFGTYQILKERSSEYNNIAYALYKALSKSYPKFQNMQEKEDEPIEKLVVREIKKSPIIYIVELQLPNYINDKKLVKDISNLQDMLRENANDTAVSILIESFNGLIVIKLLRLPKPNEHGINISLGDILRFTGAKINGKTVLEQYTSSSFGMPILLGLTNNEHPTIIDYEANTSGVIVGGSGSGKSWTTFSWMWNFVLANSPEEVQFLILDMKDSNFWQQFSMMPHVIGLHGSDDFDNFITILEEVEEERKRRQKFLKKLGIEDVKEARKLFKEQIKEGNKDAEKYLKEIPLFNIIIDEITATTLEYSNLDDKKESYKKFRGLLGTLTAKGRSAGIRLLQIGQRATDADSIYKTTMANSSLKFGMRMDTESDFKLMFGDEIVRTTKPASLGMGLLSAMDTSINGNPMVKTLTLGVSNNAQMTALIRIVAFDWLRRVQGNMDLRSLPSGTKFTHTVFNRDKIYDETIKEAKEGYLLGKLNKTPEYAFDLENIPLNPYENALASIKKAEIVEQEDSEDDVEQEEVSENPINEQGIVDYFNDVEEETEDYTYSDEDEEEESISEEPVETYIEKEPIEEYESVSEGGVSLEELLASSTDEIIEQEEAEEAEEEEIKSDDSKQQEQYNTMLELLQKENDRVAELENKLKESELKAQKEQERLKKKEEELKKKELQIMSQNVTMVDIMKGQEDMIEKSTLVEDSKEMPIPKFIKKHGENTQSFSFRMKKEELEKYYNKRKIEHSIKLSQLIEKEGYYVITMV